MDEFLKKMSDLLKDEYPAFLKSMDEPAFRGVRLNTLKCNKNEVLKLLPFEVRETPFCKDGYYIESEVDKVGSHPLHHAGAIYMQEPSAMSAVSMLCVKEGDKVLDLCAAPGSKTTQIASALGGTGLLWSNEIVRNRASILLQNSGEGMFRKDKNARAEWTSEHALSCATRQLHILNSAKLCLRAGGELVYSTCTYSVEENEGVVNEFLAENPEFELIDSGETFGRNTLTYAKRIFPMDGGEGHFAAKFRKNYTPEDEHPIEKPKKKKRNQKSVMIEADKKAYDFLNDIFKEGEYNNLYMVGDKVYSLTDSQKELFDYDINFKKLAVLKMGVEVLVDLTKRFEPLHNAFTACKPDSAKNVVNLDINDKRLYKFLHGEEIEIENKLKGYTLVCVENIPLGFAKASGSVLKNKYPKGLRNNG